MTGTQGWASSSVFLFLLWRGQLETKQSLHIVCIDVPNVSIPFLSVSRGSICLPHFYGRFEFLNVAMQLAFHVAINHS